MLEDKIQRELQKREEFSGTIIYLKTNITRHNVTIVKLKFN